MATKLALQQMNTRLAADNAVLRELNSVLTTDNKFLREQLAERDHLARKLIGRVNRGPVSAKRLAMNAAREAAKQSGQCVKVGA